MLDRYEIEAKETFDTVSSVEENEELYSVGVREQQAEQALSPSLPENNNNNSSSSNHHDGEITTNADKGDDATTATISNHKDDTDAKATSFLSLLVDYTRYGLSVGLLLFSLLVVTAAIFSKQTTVSESTHPVLAFFVLWGLVLWLAVMEGGQGCLVGLQPIDKALYANSHPLSHKCTTLVHNKEKNNMERFIVGRQFLVVLVVFGINACGSAIQDAEILNLPDIVVEIFLSLGVALMLITIVIGQLTAQVNAASCMLDFINNYVMLFTTYLSLAIESSGLLHAVYLVQVVFEAFTGSSSSNNNKNDSKQTSTLAKMLFAVRVMISLSILAFAFAVTLAALFEGKTAMWEGVPKPVSVIIFLVLMCFVGLMEGMQIALFALINMPKEELEKNSIANANCQLVFKGSNFQAFLIGRQICVTICMFMIARVTTIDLEDGEDSIFGVPQGVQEFFNSGVLGAMITTIFASLAWRVMASSFPLAFMSNPMIYVIINVCLLLESSGFCSVAWILAGFHKRIAQLTPDQQYINKAKANKGGVTNMDDSDLEVGSA